VIINAIVGIIIMNLIYFIFVGKYLIQSLIYPTLKMTVTYMRNEVQYNNCKSAKSITSVSEIAWVCLFYYSNAVCLSSIEKYSLCSKYTLTKVLTNINY
jgi:hypothetical protein